MTSSFAVLGVPTFLVESLAQRGISDPTPIQAATLPDSLAGRDVLGRGKTGSGKTYAFLLPLVAHLTAKPMKPKPNRPRALILAPTRELVNQIEQSFATLTAGTRLTSRVVFGGVGQAPQVQAVRQGVDVVIACPGRLEDLMRQGHINLDAIEVTIIDEADHMADLGFLPGVTRILGKTPRTGQRMLFSATLDAGVDVLVKRFLNQPVTHEADSEQSPVETMDHHVLQVASDDHIRVLTDLTAAPGRTIVFARTKHRAKKFARELNAKGVPTVELHGNLSQNARTRTMDAFHSGAASTLVATDIAARGIHVDDVALVIHADPPVEHKAYLHRSGRTARAGSAGTVVTLMTPGQNGDVRALMHKAGIRPTTTEVRTGHPLLHELAPGVREFPGGIVIERPEQPAPRRKAQSTTGAGRAAAPGRGHARPAASSGGGRGSRSRPASAAATNANSRSRGHAASGRRRTAADFSAGR
jgi:superfamily II DNA/RNA helicase